LCRCAGADGDVTDRCPPLQRTTEANRRYLNIHASSQEADSTCCCPHCEKSLSCQRALKKHMNIHSGKYKCTECGKCCEDGSKLAIHRRCHSGEQPFECTVCGKRFSQSCNLVNHSRVHSGEKPYKCHHCDKAFSQSGSLTTHMAVHTEEKPHKCSLCDKSFTVYSSLWSHKRFVHSSSRPHECPYCGLMFKINSQLKSHVRIHTDAKPYSCRHCSDCFTWRSQLLTHLLKLHNEGTWFTCDICQMKFSSSGVLKQHVHRHEAVKPYVAVNVQSVSTEQMN